MQTNVNEARTHLPELLERAAGGEEIIIARRGKPMAILGPLRQKRFERESGGWKGKAWVAPDFDAPLPELDSAKFVQDRNSECFGRLRRCART